jgi:RNA polymerase sigma-70 factor, ECF subfamily
VVDPLTEQGIKRLLRRADTGALEQIYDAYGSALYRYLLAMLGRHAAVEDALQDLFVHVAKKCAQLAEADNLHAYLIRIARNIALKHIRARRDSSEIDDFLVAANPLDHGLDDQQRAHVSRALSALPDEQREVVALKTFEGLTFEQIGELLDISPNTAASRYRYGTDKLAQQLKGLKNVI